MDKKNNYSNMVERQKKLSVAKAESIANAIKSLQVTHSKVTAKRVAEIAHVSIALVYRSEAYKSVAGNMSIDDSRTSDSNVVMNSVIKQELERKQLQCKALREENKRLKETVQQQKIEIRTLKSQLKVQSMDKLAEEFDAL